MANYALVNDGMVVNVVIWDGVLYTPAVPEVLPDKNGEGGSPEIPAFGWSPPEGHLAVILPEGVSIGFAYDEATGEFSAPPMAPPPPVTESEMIARRNSLLDYATQQINPLQDLVDIGESTPEDEALLLLWKKYRAAVGKATSQPGWPLTVVWPTAPV